MTVQHVEEFKWTVERYLGMYRYHYQTGLVQSVSAYWRQSRQFASSNPVGSAVVTMWKMEKAAEDLECGR